MAAATGSARTTDLGLGGLASGGMGALAAWAEVIPMKAVPSLQPFWMRNNKRVVQAHELIAKDLPPPVANRKTAG